MKAGGVAVATMPLLRAKDLASPIKIARPRLALCDARLVEELEKTRDIAPGLERIVTFGAGELEAMMAEASPHFDACDTACDDVCLLGFTSGTTGGPKATMHFHRDVLAIADSYGAHVLRARADDHFHRLAAARLHLRPRRPRRVPARRRRRLGSHRESRA